MRLSSLKLSLSFIILLLVSTLLFSQELKVRSYAEPASIGKDEDLTYTIEIIGQKGFKATAPQLPELDDFSLKNMMTSSSSSYSIYNGNVSESVTKSFIYRLLPKRTGNLRIPEILVKVGGKIYYTQPVNVRVLDISRAGRAPSGQTNPFGSGQGLPLYMQDPFNLGFDSVGDMEIAAVPEKTNVYVGEPLLVTYRFYTTQPVSSLELKDEKDFGGYGKELYSEPTRLNFEQVQYKNQRYKSAVIKTVAISPNKAGEIELPQLTANVQLGSIGFYSQTLQSLSSKVKVKELPANGKPQNYSGAVGNFSVSEQMEKNVVRVGEALEYKLVISGRGNFNQFSNPVYPVQQDFRIASPLTENQIQAGMKGTRTIRYLLIPRREGKFTLPGISFNWFNPVSSSYQYFNSKPRIIEVKPGNVLTYLSNVFQKESIKTLTAFKPKANYKSQILIVNSTLYWLLIILIIISLLPSWLYARNEKLKNTDPDLAAQRGSARVLKKYLKQAEDAVQFVSRDFYPKAEQGLMHYLSDKYHISRRYSNQEKIYQLRLKGLDEDLIERLEAFLNRCQEARFMPGGFDEVVLSSDLDTLKQIIKSFIRLPDRTKKSLW